MPISKNVPQQQEQKEVITEQKPFMINDVPLDMYRVFDEDINNVTRKDLDKLKEIYEWSLSECEDPTLGNVMIKISRLQNSLGAPAINEKKYDKLWRYIHISRKMKDLDKQRESLRRQWVI